MKNLKDEINKAAPASKKKICLIIRDSLGDCESHSKWYCINCGTDQVCGDQCSYCKVGDYLIPDIEKVREILASDKFLENIRQIVHDGLDFEIGSSQQIKK